MTALLLAAEGLVEGHHSYAFDVLMLIAALVAAALIIISVSRKSIEGALLPLILGLMATAWLVL